MSDPIYTFIYTSSANLHTSFSSKERVNDAESDVILRMRIVSPAVSVVYVLTLDIHVVFARGRFCRWQSLPEKAKYIHGFVHELRLASNVAIAMIWPRFKRKNNEKLVKQHIIKVLIKLLKCIMFFIIVN
jgi:hypothetical protein